MNTSKPVLTWMRPGIGASQMLAASALSLVIIASQTSSAAVGDEPAKPPVSKPAARQGMKTVPSKEERVEITGSHIKQKVRRTGQHTALVSPVFVVDRAAIERSGASNIPGVLAKTIGTR